MPNLVLVADAAQLAADQTAHAPRLMADAVEQHPLLRLMPAPVREAISETGALRRAVMGDLIEGRPVVGFVTGGVVAASDPRGLACVEVHGPGSMFGWEAALDAAYPPARLLTLVEASWVEAPADIMAQTMGEPWVEHVFARHALDRLNRLASEASCSAVHPVPARVANLVRRLFMFSGPQVRTTQAMIAQAMGVQRTSVNSAMKGLERSRAVGLRRGRIEVLDPVGLMQASCGC